MKTIISIVLLLTLFSTRIVHDRTTQKCTVVDRPPVTNIRTISLATDSIYKSRKDANSAMKDIKVCSPQK
jgi:hypothetical protein